MKPFSIRVPDDIHEKLKDVDKKVIRKALAECVGVVYEDDKSKMFYVQDLVREYIQEHIKDIKFDTEKEKEVVSDDLTNKAFATLSEMIG